MGGETIRTADPHRPLPPAGKTAPPAVAKF